MALQVREGYINPLTMMNRNKNGMGSKSPLNREEGGNGLQNLQNEKQSMQNKMLLMQATSDGGEIPKETKELMEKKLEELSKEIKKLESEGVQKVPEEEERTSATPPRFDIYEQSKVGQWLTTHKGTR